MARACATRAPARHVYRLTANGFALAMELASGDAALSGKEMLA